MVLLLVLLGGRDLEVVAVHGLGGNRATRLACRLLAVLMRHPCLLCSSQRLLVVAVRGIDLSLVLIQMRAVLSAIPSHVLKASVMVAALIHVVMCIASLV